jgi:hypothetical protein
MCRLVFNYVYFTKTKMLNTRQTRPWVRVGTRRELDKTDRIAVRCSDKDAVLSAGD